MVQVNALLVPSNSSSLPNPRKTESRKFLEEGGSEGSNVSNATQRNALPPSPFPTPTPQPSSCISPGSPFDTSPSRNLPITERSLVVEPGSTGSASSGVHVLCCGGGKLSKAKRGKVRCGDVVRWTTLSGRSGWSLGDGQVRRVEARAASEAKSWV